MLDCMSKKVLSVMRKNHKDYEKSGFTYGTLQELTNINEYDLKRCIKHLASKKLVNVFTGSFVSGYTTIIFLTHEAKNLSEFAFNNFVDFLVRSILVPIIVAVITTLVTMWVSGFFTR